jgi:hypothetical protein
LPSSKKHQLTSALRHCWCNFYARGLSDGGQSPIYYKFSADADQAVSGYEAFADEFA